MTLVSQFKSLALLACSFTYFGALLHYTLDPIAELERCQGSVKDTQLLLQNVRDLKIEELELVKKAVRCPPCCLKQRLHIRCQAALSAAAAIGTLSWPTTASAYWLSELFWYTGLWFSIFALVSFSQQRMIDQISKVQLKDSSEADSKAPSRALLLLFLRPQRGGLDLEQGRHMTQHLAFDWRLAFLWQYPMMMMSYSWVCFLLGYTIYLLSPLLSADDERTRVASRIVAISVGALAALNFQANSWLSRRALRAVKEYQDRYVAKDPRLTNGPHAPNVDDASKRQLSIRISKQPNGSSDVSAS